MLHITLYFYVLTIDLFKNKIKIKKKKTEFFLAQIIGVEIPCEYYE